MSESQKLILVLGAHRSGTSLSAAAVVSLGADACLGEHYANDENLKGFFEHPDIVDFNDRLLAHLGGSWDNPLFDGAGAIAGQDLSSWREQAAALLGEVFGAAPVAVLKDPRICQLLDFWIPVFGDAGFGSDHIYCVHTLRDPVEVALSQRNRAAVNPDFYELGIELAEGAALWLSLTGQALERGAQLNTHYLSYRSLMTDTAAVLRQLAGFAGLEPDPDQVQSFCESFVDPSLYRSSATPVDREELASAFPQALELDRCLQPLLENGAGESAAVARSLEIYRRADTREALARISTPALSRLSDSCRSDRLEVKRSQEVVEDLERQKAEMVDNAERMQREHTAVVEPLRQEVDNLQQGNRLLQGQLGDQQREVERVTSIAEENRLQVERLAARTSELETERQDLWAERDALEAQRADLEKQRGELVEHVHNLETSLSWRITRPLRSLSHRLRATRHGLAGRWVQFRLQAILVYHRMSLRHPGLAWTIRRLVRPVFRLLNRLFRTGPKEIHSAGQDQLLEPMLYQQHEASDDFAPLISVIVPNYNHAPYLPLRLDSIYSQSYANFEVILLDDASSDDSARILREYARRYAEKTTLVINEENSGGVFHQWDRGFSLASGDIVWIAESDDWCTENFLETLVPYFENEAIQLAYARTVFMDGEGEKQTWSINEYLHDIDPQRWNSQIVATGPAIVREAFAMKNIVPNVSSALFRTPRSLEILRDPEWRQMKTCGDWVLYLHLLRGGMLAYSPNACNYYRIHDSNTSVGSYSQDKFYAEHELVANTIQQYYDVPPEVFARLRDNLEIHWRETRGEYSDEALERCFSLARIEEAAARKAPNLLMASYAFCAGGGETFPVSLASIMKGRGYNVTYLDCDREPRNEGVRNNLRRDIPIVSDFSQLERIIEDFEIDVIHSHHAWMDSTILDILPETTQCKTIVTLHGMYETINEYDLRPILPRLVRRSACLIYVAEKNLDALRQHELLDHANTVRIDNALPDLPFDTIERASLGIDDNAFVLTLVSRAMVEKGWAEAIASVTAARESTGHDIHLLLVGDGPEYDRLSREALPAYIHLEGFQSNVRGYFAVADCGFLPSKFRGESFPLVIIECLQAGRPFLSSDLGEIGYMLDSDQGMAGAVVALDGDEVDVGAVAAEIARLAGDRVYYRELRDRVALVADKFDPGILAQKHDEVYRRAVQQA